MLGLLRRAARGVPFARRVVFFNPPSVVLGFDGDQRDPQTDPPLVPSAVWRGTPFLLARS